MQITPKTPWRKGMPDRRTKEGCRQDRKLSADILRINREHDRKIQEIEKPLEHNAFVLAVCLLTALFILVLWPHKAHAESIPLKASWYSTESLKREGTWAYSKGRMANGHIFNDNKYTCATRLFPLGSMVRVTNSISKSFVDVKVTDRIGKRFAKTRIDLSKKAFEKLADLNDGLINVVIERI
jgi:hypothetical protein